MLLKKLLFAGLLVPTIGLAGCATNGTGVVIPPVLSDPTVQADISAIKGAVQKACGYSVPVADIASIIGTFVPGVELVGSVTTAICKAVTALGVRRGEVAPQVNGVILHGYFLRKHGVHRHH